MSRNTKETILAYLMLFVVVAIVGGVLYFFYFKLGCIDGRPLGETPNICLLMR